MKVKPFFRTIIFIIVGLITNFILLGAKVVFERTDVGSRIESYGYELLQSYLPSFTSREEMPLIVIDIGKLEGGTDEQPTPRDKLKEIIGAVAKQNPRAIALAIDFSPKKNGGWQDRNDPEFFDYCLSLREDTGTPIFLGVGRSIKDPPDAWLGVKNYKSLAVGLDFQHPNTNKVFLWTRPANTPEHLPSLSLALAKTYRESLPAPPALFAPMLAKIEDYDPKTEKLNEGKQVYAKALVNYSMLGVIETQSVATRSAGSIEEFKERFRNKLVLIGRITEARDRIRVVGRNPDVPGVLLHASAVYTLVESPLFELTHGARILIDLLLPLSILIFIAAIRYRNRGNADYDWHRKEWRAFIITIALVFVSGIMLVRWLGIIWFDFLIVIIALLLHPLLEKAVGSRIDRWLKRRDKSAPAGEGVK